MKVVVIDHGAVWKWPGDMGWHFVTLDKILSAKIKKTAKTYGAGFVKVRATIDKSTWETALFPHAKSGAYLLSIKNAIRKKEDVFEGDTVRIRIEII